MFAGEGAAPPPIRKQGGPGKPWLEAETVHLIDAYEEKWYALRRGQLRAHQWEEVAATVAARLGLSRPSKNGTQCRHKIEKLRQRFRAERLRAGPSRWTFFDRMDRMERGPLPITVRPPPLLPPTPPQPDDSAEDDDVDAEEGNSGPRDADGDSSDEDDDLEDPEVEEANGNMRSINGILSEDKWRCPRISRYDGEHVEEDEVGEGKAWAARELSAAVRRFREGFSRLEKRRLELTVEMEREWMKMEAKRAEMMAASQQRFLDSIAEAFGFGAAKKTKRAQEK